MGTNELADAIARLGEAAAALDDAARARPTRDAAKAEPTAAGDPDPELDLLAREVRDVYGRLVVRALAAGMKVTAGA